MAKKITVESNPVIRHIGTSLQLTLSVWFGSIWLNGYSFCKMKGNFQNTDVLANSHNSQLSPSRKSYAWAKVDVLESREVIKYNSA